ncbi:MAG TPA: hypothetical protein VKB46_22840 [Pyrinomonadaceae bacterium]|nr:hypothetical protein [Pyrinomonadaceae bacterium]
MKVALKYGLLITLGVALWIVVAHTLVPDPNSKVHTLGAGVFFNLLEVVGIYLGIKAKGKEAGGPLTFKDGLKTGVNIAFVYAVTVSLFFVGVISFMGTKLMHVDPSMTTQPMSRIVLGAFAGLFLGALIFGLFYSAVISFLLAKRLSQ